MRGDKIVIPQADLGNEVGNLRQWVVELAHEGHMGGPAAKRTLRKRLWFPSMDSMVEARTSTCEPCQPSTPIHSTPETP